MKRFFATTVCLMFGCLVLNSLSGHAGPPTLDPVDAVDGPAMDPTIDPHSAAWGMQIVPVPDVLRMHLPMLRRDFGLLVHEVSPDGPAQNWGVRRGDVLIEANGTRLSQRTSLDDPDQTMDLLVIRRGVMQLLSPRPTGPFRQPGFAAGPSRPAWWPNGVLPGAGALPPGRFASSSTSVSSSSSGHGESVSVSQAGDQISLDISSPSPAIGRLQFRGTTQDIQRELQGGNWSDEAKAAVRRALNQ